MKLFEARQICKDFDVVQKDGKTFCRKMDKDKKCYILTEVRCEVLVYCMEEHHLESEDKILEYCPDYGRRKKKDRNMTLFGEPQERIFDCRNLKQDGQCKIKVHVQCRLL